MDAIARMCSVVRLQQKRIFISDAFLYIRRSSLSEYGLFNCRAYYSSLWLQLVGVINYDVEQQMASMNITMPALARDKFRVCFRALTGYPKSLFRSRPLVEILLNSLKAWRLLHWMEALVSPSCEPLLMTSVFLL